ncbi:MAG: 50S ribosomal protein L22 [Patescibacteria group bacterium]
MDTQNKQPNKHNNRNTVASRSSIGVGVRQTVQLNYLRMAPRKVRLVASLVVGLPVVEAEAQLMYERRRAAKPLLKLIRSAVAAVKAKKGEAAKFVIESFTVDQGPMLKRSLPRARGSASPIQKKMSHVTLTLAERENLKPARFKIVVPKKAKAGEGEKASPKKKRVAAKSATEPSAPDAPKTPKNPGFFRKVFNRKAGM